MANSAVPYIEEAKGKPLRSLLTEHKRGYSEVDEVLTDLKISRSTLKRYLKDHGGRIIQTIWLPDEEQP